LTCYCFQPNRPGNILANDFFTNGGHLSGINPGITTCRKHKRSYRQPPDFFRCRRRGARFVYNIKNRPRFCVFARGPFAGRAPGCRRVGISLPERAGLFLRRQPGLRLAHASLERPAFRRAESAIYTAGWKLSSAAAARLSGRLQMDFDFTMPFMITIIRYCTATLLLSRKFLREDNKKTSLRRLSGKSWNRGKPKGYCLRSPPGGPPRAARSRRKVRRQA